MAKLNQMGQLDEFYRAGRGSESQRAMCAARTREMFDQQAKERQKATLKRGNDKPVPVNLPEREGDARDAAGKAFGVSGKLVDQARAVQQKGAGRGIDSRTGVALRWRRFEH
jgi:hypothetical protein